MEVPEAGQEPIRHVHPPPQRRIIEYEGKNRIIKSMEDRVINNKTQINKF